jgi:hypothetical protein
MASMPLCPQCGLHVTSDLRTPDQLWRCKGREGDCWQRSSNGTAYFFHQTFSLGPLVTKKCEHACGLIQTEIRNDNNTGSVTVHTQCTHSEHTVHTQCTLVKMGVRALREFKSYTLFLLIARAPIFTSVHCVCTVCALCVHCVFTVCALRA